MSQVSDWAFPEQLRPQAEELPFDLAAALRSVVLLRAEIPEDAFTASILGTERVGNAVLIRQDGLLLTIGYLVTEAENIWITSGDGTVVPGHALAYDAATGFGLVLPLGRIEATPLRRGSVATVKAGSRVFAVSHGGIAHALEAQVIAKREFAGYWEYVLDEALFTVPAHPHWSGAALLDDNGRLIGIGSLLVQEQGSAEDKIDANMFVPVDLLEPVLEEMSATGRPARAPRPWLGMYTMEMQGHLVVSGLAEQGPAAQAGVKLGDLVLQVAGQPVSGLAELFRTIWQLGPVGTDVPLTLARGDAQPQVRIRSADRNDFLRKPLRH
ncbi:MAG TPA: S1C family serine protease [Steroidobacteraceae bacterium]|jgi:S1-C subfamily serine protease|nr:S1C family serine protease [Steroidobacteraceae bacterium]